MKPKQIGIVLFNDFETLDVFGPVQIWGRLADHGLTFVSADGRPVQSSHGVRITPDHSFASAPPLDVLMVPGGAGTRRLVDDAALLAFVRRQDEGSSWTTSVCTGAAILARAGRPRWPGGDHQQTRFRMGQIPVGRGDLAFPGALGR